MPRAVRGIPAAPGVPRTVDELRERLIPLRRLIKSLRRDLAEAADMQRGAQKWYRQWRRHLRHREAGPLTRDERESFRMLHALVAGAHNVAAGVGRLPPDYKSRIRRAEAAAEAAEDRELGAW